MADLIRQLFYGNKIDISCNLILLSFERYLGDIKFIDPLTLWTCTSIIVGLALSIIPLIESYGIISLPILFAIHSFFLSASNALGNIIMIEFVGIHHYFMPYGLSLFVSSLASLFGYPRLGKYNE